MFDVIIIGAGPAGMTAGIYAKRANLNVVVIEKGAPGGQMVTTGDVENYTGLGRLTGPELSMKMYNHASLLEVPFLFESVIRISTKGTTKIVQTENNVYEAKAIIIASGVVPRKLGLAHEEELSGRGVSWCAICDGPLYKGKKVLVVGGGNSAIDEATYLATLASEVIIVQNLPHLTADQKSIDICMQKSNVKFMFNSELFKFNVNNQELESVEIRNNLTKTKETIKVDGVFEYIGLIPSISFAKELAILNKFSYIDTNDKMVTNLEGVFAAGDIRAKQIRQIVTATSDGAIAVQNVLRYLEEWR